MLAEHGLHDGRAPSVREAVDGGVDSLEVLKTEDFAVSEGDAQDVFGGEGDAEAIFRQWLAHDNGLALVAVALSGRVISVLVGYGRVTFLAALAEHG